MNTTNHQYKLAARPVGLPKQSDWAYIEESVPDLYNDEILVKQIYISLDPAMRGWMNEGKSYAPPVKINDVMRALGVGVVVDSKNNQFAKGDHVSGIFGVQEYAISNGEGIHKVDKNLAPLPLYLSVLGMPGLTAYFGLLDVGKAKQGDTIVVSGAAGAVGAVVGQIAKIKGCRVVGIAGGADKCKYITQECGFDAAIDYKSEDVRKMLKQHCPNGIDVYFDNVGGDILNAALSLLAMHARVVICGAISQYNNTEEIKGPSNYLSLLVNRARMEGFIVFDYKDRYNEALAEMASWVKAGKLKSREHIVHGIETFPDTLLKLFSGENNGKLLLKISDE